jgi:tripartite-type tricarboxylate transporter receptor subunit TctC
MIREIVAAMAFGGLSTIAAMPSVQAADYPTKPITFVIGFAPGGPSDVLARVVTTRMGEILKQPFIIENRPGAGGSIAAQTVARAAPDGYTMLLATNGILVVNPHLYKNVGYDIYKDFEPISVLGIQPNVFYVHPSVPARTLPELIAYAKANPGKLNYGSGGNGTSSHLAGELLKLEAKISMTHVPFRGTGPVLQAVIANHIQIGVNPPAALVGHIESGAIRALAVSSPKRAEALPTVPTVAELGFPGFDASSWHSLMLPAGTPKDVVDVLYRALMTTLKDSAIRRQLTDLGVDVIGNTPDEFRAYIKSEDAKWGNLVKTAGVKID